MVPHCEAYSYPSQDLKFKIKKLFQMYFVSDDDKYGNDFIGEARIPLIHLKPQEPKHLNVYLEKHYPVKLHSS